MENNLGKTVTDFLYKIGEVLTLCLGNLIILIAALLSMKYFLMKESK